MVHPAHRRMTAAPLRPGDRVAVVAPSSPSDPDHLRAGVDRWRGHFALLDDPRPFARDGFLAGDDGHRADALLDALRDREVRALMVSRGGYGAMRVLERAGDALLAALRDDPKPVVGFSDVTALHALWSRAGVRSVHATMVAAAGRGAEIDSLRAVLHGEAPARWEALDAWVPAREDVTGIARGGNLALIAALVGTPWALDLDGAVLFIEDIGEAPYRVDRMLTTLRLAGALRGVRAAVVGEFTNCRAGADGVTVEAVLRGRLGDLGVPVLAGAPFGHGAHHAPWVQGGAVTVTPDGALVHEDGIGPTDPRAPPAGAHR